MDDCQECEEKNREISKLSQKSQNLVLVERSLTKELLRYKAMFNKYDYTNTKVRTLPDRTAEAFQKSLMPLNLEMISTMTKMQLKLTILLREGFYYEKIDEFENNIKHNDREVFHNMKQEIQNLNRLLLDESILYRENQKLKERIQTLLNRIEGYKLRLLKVKNET